jgi:hypothetical protein
MVQRLIFPQMKKNSMQEWWSNKYKTRFYSTRNLPVHLTLTLMIWVFALQASYQGGGTPNDESGIIQYVYLAYQEYDPAKINMAWLTLMAVLNRIIEHLQYADFQDSKEIE